MRRGFGFGRAQRLGDVSVPNLFNALANGNAAEALASVYRTIEIHTALTPPIVIDVASLAAGSNGQSSYLAGLVKPAVILRGAAGGDLSLTPYGDPGDGTLGLIAVFAGLLGAGFVLGRLSKR